MMTRILTGETERIHAIAMGAATDPVTGVTDLLLSVYRVSDGYRYDWDDDTFKASGHTTPEVSMTELDSSDFPGVYYHDFDTDDITNPADRDTYCFYMRQSPGTTVANLPQMADLKVGVHVGDVVVGA